jgi:hypothetical protein
MKSRADWLTQRAIYRLLTQGAQAASSGRAGRAVQNVKICFAFTGLCRYAIQRRFIGLLGNSTLNVTRKTAIRAISVLLVKFNVEFPRQPMNLPIESYSISQSRALIGSRSDQYFVVSSAHLYQHALRPAFTLFISRGKNDKRYTIQGKFIGRLRNSTFKFTLQNNLRQLFQNDI